MLIIVIDIQLAWTGGGKVMPLSYATPGEESVIRKIGGSPEVKKHLENLGFVVGGTTA